MKKTLTAIMVALGLTSISALAETRINGFASIMAGVMTDDDASLFGYSDNISFKPESLFALQVSSDLGDGLSATAQIMSRGKDDFITEFEWAYLSYEVNDSTQINAGKLRIPFYRYSDFLDVGYAYTWARTPQTVYGSPFSTLDGVSVVNNHTIGDWDSSVQAIFGSYDGTIELLSESDDTQLTNILGVNWTLTYDWLTARAVYMIVKTSISFDNEPLSDVELPDGSVVQIQALNVAIDQIGAILPDAADSLSVSDDLGSFFGLGFSVDYNNVLIDSEFTTVEVEDSIVAAQEQYYVSVGYRLGTYTVYAITEHSERTNDDNYSSQLPAVFNVPGQTFYPQATYQALLASQEQENDALTVGVRYNFHPAAALKFDYTTLDTLVPSISNKSVESSLVSIGINIVF